jgi:hypothetical protein
MALVAVGGAGADEADLAETFAGTAVLVEAVVVGFDAPTIAVDFEKSADGAVALQAVGLAVPERTAGAGTQGAGLLFVRSLGIRISARIHEGNSNSHRTDCPATGSLFFLSSLSNSGLVPGSGTRRALATPISFSFVVNGWPDGGRTGGMVWAKVSVASGRMGAWIRRVACAAEAACTGGRSGSLPVRPRRVRYTSVWEEIG